MCNPPAPIANSSLAFRQTLHELIDHSMTRLFPRTRFTPSMFQMAQAQRGVARQLGETVLRVSFSIASKIDMTKRWRYRDRFARRYKRRGSSVAPRSS
jgi:hypothetical protein